MYTIYQNNESVSPNPRNQLENYTIYVVDIEKGILVDKTMFKTDKIVLSHNQGIYLYRNVLAILSIQHQTIHIFHLEADGTLVKDREIGRFCYDDDDMVLSSSGVLKAKKIMYRIENLKYTINMYIVQLSSRDKTEMIFF